MLAERVKIVDLKHFLRRMQELRGQCPGERRRERYQARCSFMAYNQMERIRGEIIDLSLDEAGDNEMGVVVDTERLVSKIANLRKESLTKKLLSILHY